MATEEKKAAARRWFDRRANRYEQGRGSRWLATVQREAIGALELAPADQFLDVGCGPGAAIRQAAHLVKRGVGIDLSPEMIRRARERADGLANVQFQVADAEHLPFADREFSVLLCSTSFHHYPDPQRAVNEMPRVLQPGGRLVLADACADLTAARVADVFLRRLEPGHVRLYRSSELGAFVHAAGLSAVQVRKVSSGGYAIVRARRPG